MRADDRALADLAASVADGEPVDWQGAESRAAAADRRLVRHLRLVENIASLYRSIPADEDDDFAHAAIDPAPVAEPSGPRWGRLVMLEVIGRGASGNVCRAWDSELHREVALKLLDDRGPGDSTRDTHARVLQEARRLARVRHPHVVQVYGAEQHDGRVGLWMELVRGESLEQIVAARGPFGAAEAAIIGQDLCAALASVHAAGLLHRDVKAQNVLRESGGRTVLMDFGTGEELRGESGTARLAGTPLYLAPELLRGQTASVQSDLYSLGVLLFYLVSGQFPVTAASIEGLARAHAEGHKRRLRDVRPDLPVSFVRIVERALDPEPSARYRTAGEMEAALRDTALTREKERASRAAWFPFGRPWLSIAALAVLAVGVSLAAIVWSRQDGAADRGAAPPVRSVAVLPLQDVSGPSAEAYLAPALTDQLIATLGQIGSLRVASRTSVMHLTGDRPSLQQIFDTLGVDALIEGSVAVSPAQGGNPGRVRVNARLFTAGSGTHLWGQTVERPLGETLALQNELARQIANAVRATLTDAEARRLAQVRSTSAAAEEAYFQGRFHLGQYGIDRARRALDAFNRAIEIDPAHSSARAGAARAYISLGEDGAISQPDARVSALREVTKALEASDELPEAHASLADLKFRYDWDWVAGEREYRRAIELNPSYTYARSQYARYLAAAGRLAEAAEESNAARELDPLSAVAAQTHGVILYYRRDFPAAIEALLRALELDPGYARAEYVLGRVYEAQGMLEQAIAATDKALKLAPEAGVTWRLQQIRLQALTGRRDQARTQMKALLAELQRQKLRVSAQDLGYFHAALGEPEPALSHLQRAVDERDPRILWLRVDPRVDTLRADPRFDSLLRRIGPAQP